MDALQKHLQVKPAFPEGFPARRAIALAGQIASHACDLDPEVAHRQSGRRLTSARRHQSHNVWVEHFLCTTLWGRTREITQLRTSAQQGERASPTSGSSALRFAADAPGYDSPFSGIGDTPRSRSRARYQSARCQASWQQVTSREVSKIHSSGSSPSGVSSSHTRTTHTGKGGSVLRRGSWRGGRSESDIHDRCKVVARAWRP